MSKLLLIHNSDTLFETLKPANDKRPNFYWYTDRFCSHQGTSKYLYIFAVDPAKDNVELRSRSTTQDFDSLHKDFLNYRDYCEGKHPELKYAEAGIAMSFSELTPNVILQARTYGSGKDDWLQTEYEIIKPHKPFSKRVISLFEAPYTELFAGKPIKFNDIPELAELLPDINDILPFKNIEPDPNGTYSIDNWVSMSSHEGGTWL
jgi:hypothetical protein